MTSIPGTGFIKQIPSDSRNFIPVSSLMNFVFGLNEATATFTIAPWCQGNATVNPVANYTPSAYASSIASAGAGKLRDMGKTYVSSGRAFRKVQLIVPNIANGKVQGAGASTFGVAGESEAAQPLSDYLTGYIELGWEGQNQGAPVARSP